MVPAGYVTEKVSSLSHPNTTSSGKVQASEVATGVLADVASLARSRSSSSSSSSGARKMIIVCLLQNKSILSNTIDYSRPRMDSFV
mmetsp:Transcript_19109/g.28834  ORF Transcript_19109/g.28834 Transcript_19109/m.28834 type:complete len:86 (-) Transcript_19109:19-276(-)